MIAEIARALRTPIYFVAAVLLLGAYVFVYQDYLRTVTAEPVKLDITVK
jgi:hypothetical protein